MAGEDLTDWGQETRIGLWLGEGTGRGREGVGDRGLRTEEAGLDVRRRGRDTAPYRGLGFVALVLISGSRRAGRRVRG